MKRLYKCRDLSPIVETLVARVDKKAINHEFYLDSKSIYYVVIHIIIWYINTRNKNEIKNGLQSSQQWYILDEYLRFDKKEVLTV